MFLKEPESEPPPKKKKNNPKILDGTFYSIVSNKDDKVEAKCSDCSKIVKGSVTSTGNFKSHYKMHPDSLKRLEQHLQNNDSALTNGNLAKTLKQPAIQTLLPSVSEEQVCFVF